MLLLRVISRMISFHNDWRHSDVYVKDVAYCPESMTVTQKDRVPVKVWYYDLIYVRTAYSYTNNIIKTVSEIMLHCRKEFIACEQKGCSSCHQNIVERLINWIADIQNIFMLCMFHDTGFHSFLTALMWMKLVESLVEMTWRAVDLCLRQD